MILGAITALTIKSWKRYSDNYSTLYNDSENANDTTDLSYSVKITPTITKTFRVVEKENEYCSFRSIMKSPQPSPEHQALGDNMNHFTFRGTGIFAKNNHKHNLFPNAVTKEDAIEKCVQDGYIQETIEIEAVPFERPTPGQITAMEDHDDYIPECACRWDLSTLIDRSHVR